MNIDFIKWMCEKAEGFEWEVGSGLEAVKVGTASIFTENDISGNRKACLAARLWEPIYYPLLLQRAIEGVNRTDKTYTIEITEMVCVFEYLPEDDGIWFNDAKSIDEEKESALMHIYEQEKLS